MLRMIRNHADFCDLTVVALTASVMNEEVVELDQAGFDGTIAKPIDPDIFSSLIEMLLRGERVWHIA